MIRSRPGRRRRRRWHRGGHPPAAHRRLRRDAGPVDPQRRPRDRVPAVRRRAATASCSARGAAIAGPRDRGARPGARRHDLRRARRRRDHVGRPPHRRARPDGAGRHPGDAAGARRRRPVTPTTSRTSTRTPRRPPSVTSRRPGRSAQALGDATDHVAVSATKSMTGHLLGAAGALEAVFTILALRDRVAPPTINVDELDPEVDARRRPQGPAAAAERRVGRPEQRLRLRRPQRRPGVPQPLTTPSFGGCRARRHEERDERHANPIGLRCVVRIAASLRAGVASEWNGTVPFHR